MCVRNDWSGRALSENRWAGWDTRNEAKREAGYLLLNIYVHGRALYTVVHEVTAWYVQKRNAAVRDHGKTRNGAECDRQTLSDWCSWRWNVGIASRFALDIHPNVAGIGMLHLLATLYSDLRSDVMRRASEGKRKGSGGRVRNGRHWKESCM